MKKNAGKSLIIITIVFCILILSIFLVRQSSSNVISLSKSDATISANSSIENGKININTADAEQLQQLPRIGEVLSQRIIAYREENGNFTNLEEIKNVSGIGDKLFSAIMDYITIGE